MSVLAIDAGTTGVTALVISADGAVAGRGYQEFPQFYPQPGWVEHDPQEIVHRTAEVITDAMAKAGLNNLTVALERTFAPKVRVNCIMPGPFLTDISKAWDMPAFEEAARTTIPLRRGGRPDEIVGAALYLASDASSFTTGSILKIDGGLTRTVGGG